MTFISFVLLSVTMSNDNGGPTSADEELVQIATGTPAEEKEEERARKKGP